MKVTQIFYVPNGPTIEAQIKLHKLRKQFSNDIRLCSDMDIIFTIEKITPISRLTSDTNRILIFIENERNYPSLRKRLVLLGQSKNFHIIIQLSEAKCNQPKHILYTKSGHSEVDLQNKISAIESLENYLVVSEALPIVWPNTLCKLIFVKDTYEYLSIGLEQISVSNESMIVFAEQPNKEFIPTPFWKILFSASLPKVLVIDSDLNLINLRLTADAEVRAIFVFPERMLPIRRAFFMRAFDLILNFAYKDTPCAVVCLGPSNEDLIKIQEALEIFSPRVVTAPLIRRNLTIQQKLSRAVAGVVSQLLNKKFSQVMKYSERRVIFGRILFDDLIDFIFSIEPKITHIILTGAWLGRNVKKMRRQHPQVSFICDTHDVFFQLEKSYKRLRLSRSFFERRQKLLEVKDLNNFDVILTMSESDHDLLKREKLKAKIITEPGSFSHGKIDNYFQNSVVSDLSFGFIGSNNLNNKSSIEILFKYWWPKIVDLHPGSRLHIAGPICDSEIAKQFSSEYIESVRLIGYVNNLASYYNDQNIMLSPITVQGGLNFKNVEALMAGCIVFTTPTGSHCLNGITRACRIVDVYGSCLPNELSIARVDLKQSEFREQVAKDAEVIYGEKQAYSLILQEIKKNYTCLQSQTC